MNAVGGTLVLRGGAIGDFIVTLPLLEALRARFPGERIGVAAAPAIGALALAGGLADELRDLDARDFATLFQCGAPPDAALVAWLRGFERVVSLLHDPEGAVERAFGRAIVSGSPKPRDGGGCAAGQLLASVAAALRLPEADPADFRLHLPCGVHDAAEAALASGRWLAVHPGSGSPRKNWPRERWGQLLTGLLVEDRGLRVVLLGGEADELALRTVAAALPAWRIRSFAHRPLVEVAGVLAACERFLGHDSGVGHLAAALGIPTLQLFGPSDVSVWKPPQPRARVLRAPGGDLMNLTVAEVRAAWDLR